MTQRDLEQLNRSFDLQHKRQSFSEMLAHFCGVLQVMQMHRSYYASSIDYQDRVKRLLSDYEKIADNHFRDGQPMFKTMVVGLRAGLASSGNAADMLQAEVDELRKFWDKEEE